MWVGGWGNNECVQMHVFLFGLGPRAVYIYICVQVFHTPLVSVLPLVVARCGYVLSIHLSYPSIHLSIDR